MELGLVPEQFALLAIYAANGSLRRSLKVPVGAKPAHPERSEAESRGRQVPPSTPCQRHYARAERRAQSRGSRLTLPPVALRAKTHGRGAGRTRFSFRRRQ